MEEKYILIDLERSLGTGRVHFWKLNRRGYTTAPGTAGKFSEGEAEQIATSDYDNRTVKVNEKDFKKILRQYGEI